jgi:hypothetical protein
MSNRFPENGRGSQGQDTLLEIHCKRYCVRKRDRKWKKGGSEEEKKGGDTPKRNCSGDWFYRA